MLTFTFDYDSNAFPTVQFGCMPLEGREGVKWELGLACFCIGKMGFQLLGLGFESEKKAKMGMGLVFC